MRHLVAGVMLLAAAKAGGQTLQIFSPVASGMKPRLTIFADGGVKEVVSQPGDATSTTGSLGMAYQGTHFVVSGVVNVLARGDTITKGYGASLLPPASGAAENSAMLDIRYATFFRDILTRFGDSSTCNGALQKLCAQAGLHAYLAASSNVWQVTEGTASKPADIEKVPVHALGLGGFYTFFDDSLGSTPVAMGLDVTGVTRSIRGDLTIPGAANDALRRPLLGGTTATSFGGFSVGINMRFDIINAGLTYYRMAGSIAGFSHGQIVAAIALRAKLNDGELKKP
jgi:hypothetical protein